jgi:DNA-directed RNA polymerase II subunit RPB2
MRALGIISDKDIINTCLLPESDDDMEYQTLRELLRPSIYDAGSIYTQSLAISFIASFAKANHPFEVLYILSNYFIPHIGDLNFKEKAYFLGYMVKRLLKVAANIDVPTDRDSFRYKRIETTGLLLSNLFKEYYKRYVKEVDLNIDREHTANKILYNTDDTFQNLFTNQAFKNRIVEEGFRRAFKGNWGSEAYTKRVGVVQTLNRLSFNSAFSLLRKCVLQLDERANITGPRLLHSSQWGFMDPVDSPDGGDIGTHKHLAICTQLSNGFSKQIIFDFLKPERVF